MKFRKFGQIALIAAASLGLGFGVTACGPSNTIDFIYVTASKQNPGQINVYAVDSEAGSLIEIQDSPYSSGGRNPVADVSSPNGKNLYVINHDDNTVVEFAIGTDGKLYPQQTCNTPGTFPTQMAINPAGTYLYIVETYQPNYNVSVPGPGALVIFPINANGGLGATSSLCTPVANGKDSFFPVGNNPVSVNVLQSDNFVYVVNENDATVQALQIASNGSVSTVGTYKIGVSPNAVATDPTNRFLYVTDGASNQVVGFLIQTNGTLIPMQIPFSTGIFPDAIAADQRGQYVLVANYNSNTVTAYSINQSTGNLSTNATTPTYALGGAGPTCVLIEPALGRYVYTSNFLDNTVTGLYLNPFSGALSGTQNSPFRAAGQPTCSAAITHGNHSIQHVQG
ncbi:MAG TPA: beta-propeller fold lactonase family protein [Acidobacteriaceae bacterium]|nr:beta-propeller fold lactonase family protein [Acidobacteriaceae bacterium]